MGRIKRHLKVDSKSGNAFDIYEFEIQSDPDHIKPPSDTVGLSQRETVAVLGMNTQTLPTVTLFYQRTGIRTSGVSSGTYHIVTLRSGDVSGSVVGKKRFA